MYLLCSVRGTGALDFQYIMGIIYSLHQCKYIYRGLASVYIGVWKVLIIIDIMGMDLGCIRDVRGYRKGVWALARAQKTQKTQGSLLQTPLLK